MEFPRKRLAYTINVALILLTCCISILGFITYQNLNDITEKLSREALPNSNFILYKNAMIQMSELEDLINEYRIKYQKSELVAFDSTYSATRANAIVIKDLYPKDSAQSILGDSLIALVTEYHSALISLSEVPKIPIAKTFHQINDKLNTIAIENEAKRKPLKELFSGKKTRLEETQSNLETLIDNATSSMQSSIDKNKYQELQSREKINDLQNALFELLDYMENREITKSKIATLKAQELVSNTKYQISIFSLLATVLLIITLIILFIFTTRNKQYNQLLKNAKQNAESLAKSKEHFLANMSHEIRTPLNAIIGFTNQLSKASLPPTEQDQVSIIRKSSTHLLDVLNDILDFTKLQNAKLKLNKEVFYLSETIAATVELLKMKAEERGNELNLEIPEEVILVLGDAHRLRQIVLNVLGNSIKFTHHGKISLKISINELNPQSVLINMVFEDNGVGIPKESQARIFEEFEQGNNTASAQGTGLGLSIVSKIVALHDGELKLTSEEGQGTKIEITLPYDIAKDKGAILVSTQPKVTPLPKDLRILIADDEPFNLKLLEAILAPFCKQIVEAEDGEAAIAQLKNQQFDIALLDIKMPKCSGWQIAEEIKHNAGFNQHTPLIALTATVAEDAYANGSAAGFDHVMRKPFVENELIQLIAELTKTSVTHTSTTSSDTKEISPASPKLDFAPLENLGDEAFVRDMLQTFLDNSEQNLKSLVEASKQHDAKSISSLAHKIVAPARYLGAESFVSALKKIEKKGNENILPTDEEIAQIVQLHQELKHQILDYLNASA